MASLFIGSSFPAIPPDSAPVTMNFLLLSLSLGDVECEIFEALLSVIYPKFRRAQPLISTMEITCPCARASPLFASWQRSSSVLRRHTTGSCLRVSIRLINGHLAFTTPFEREQSLSVYQMRIEDVRSRILRIDGTKSRELKKLYWPGNFLVRTATTPLALFQKAELPNTEPVSRRPRHL